MHVGMNLFINSTTLREVVDDDSQFPEKIRRALCSAVEAISVQDMDELLSRHESDSTNFDGRIEENLREAGGLSTITRDYRIIPDRKFNHDLVIEEDDTFVCVEIEKSYLARFELDLLKMQAFSSNRKKTKNGPSRIFGVFIVPIDNVVASHISGNSRESSYQYLVRICGLVARIRPFDLEDILIVGYGVKEPEAKPTIQGESRPMKQQQVLKADGLLSDEDLGSLQGYPSDLWRYLRRQMASKRPSLREKLNPRSRYLGYSSGRSDTIYIYVQKQRLLMDLRLSADRADEIRAQGFEVIPRNNHQGRNGWLTGLRVPHDTDKRNEIVELLLEALQAEGAA